MILHLVFILRFYPNCAGKLLGTYTYVVHTTEITNDLGRRDGARSAHPSRPIEHGVICVRFRLVQRALPRFKVKTHEHDGMPMGL